MVRRLIILFVQRFLWKKLVKGSIKSKILTVGGFLLVAVLGGALFATVNYNMSFVQGMSWAGGLVTNGLGSLVRF